MGEFDRLRQELAELEAALVLVRQGMERMLCLLSEQQQPGTNLSIPLRDERNAPAANRDAA
jgi:hypothetical protein